MKLLFSLVALSLPVMAHATPNTSIDSFSKAKRLLMDKVYNHDSVRRTVYCDVPFDAKKQTHLPSGFNASLYESRAKRIEFEHVVPAENFGRSFKEWRDGDNACVKNGKAFKGRKCATKVSKEFRLMQADGYNLFAAVGSVNAYRSNYNFQMLSGTKSDFGSCDFHVDSRKAQPPESARGLIARTYLYFDTTYSSFRLSKQQSQLFTAWDKQYPVSQFECDKAKIVEGYQHNKNVILDERCGSL
ncbi:endonuclease [Vibrio rumoiensis]|uniref:Endonuclease I n=1 Tax=Vibrio rumoiensis 1S-45 TaxID=1188252 RepID=A0A1E5E1J8_9VIBR|nr:endonuclease [Vibrio rumoiensis]OEF25151.1 endonuclease I [Vibrio rumoiensis 1S-45]